MPVSAKTGQGIDQLLDAILLQSEVLELTAAADGLATGFVIEASIEKGRGAVATVLVKRGTLKLGDPIIAGHEFGRVRAMKDSEVEVQYFSIIYEAIDYVKQLMSGLLAPEIKESIVGTATVREVFRSSKFGVVAGCLVTEGAVKRNNPIRVLRDSVVIFEGALESLRRFKDDVNEVRAGTECGIGVKNYQDVRVGDQIECFARVEVARSIQ